MMAIEYTRTRIHTFKHGERYDRETETNSNRNDIEPCESMTMGKYCVLCIPFEGTLLIAHMFTISMATEKL